MARAEATSWSVWLSCGQSMKAISGSIAATASATARLLASLTSYFIQKDGLRVELLDYRSPGVFGTPASRRNQLGLTHLSFVVEDVDAAAAELERYGGTIVEGTRSGQDDPTSVQIIFLADPDGTRVELMRLAAGQEW